MCFNYSTEAKSNTISKCYISQEEFKEEEIYNLKIELDQMRTSFKKESHDLMMQIKAKDEQLRSANDYLETLSLERESDRVEITRLSQTLAQERKGRDCDKMEMNDLRDQVMST